MNDALNDLREMWKANQSSSYPSFPVKYIPTPTFSDRTSNGLTRCIIEYVRLCGWHAERIANMGRPVDTGVTTKWIRGQGMNGTADIHCCIGGRFVVVEVKTGRDKQSEDQKRYQKQIESAGGVYIVARTFDQVRAELDVFFNKL